MTYESMVTARFLHLAALMFTAAHLHAAAPTAYLTLCCNAKTPISVLDPQSLSPIGSLYTGATGDSIALSPDSSLVYATSEVTPELQVISATNGSVVATVPIPVTVDDGPFLVAASPDGARVYVWVPYATPGGALLMSIDTTAFQVVGSLALGTDAGDFDSVLVSPDSKQIYVEMDNGAASDIGVQIIDAQTLTLGALVLTGQYSTGLAITPDGKVIDSNAANQLVIIDPKSAAIVNRFTLPAEDQQPVVLAASPDSSTAYISFIGPSILAFNINTGQTEFDAPVSTGPFAVAVSPDGKTLYCADGRGMVSSFNTVSQQTIQTLDEPGQLAGVALSKTALYVLEKGDSGVAAVDVATRTLTQLSYGGTALNSLALKPGGSGLWVSDLANTTPIISVLNPANFKSKVNIPGYYGQLVFSPDGSKLYIGKDNSVVILDAPSLKELAIIPFGGLQFLQSIVLSPDGSTLYASVGLISGVKRQPSGGDFLAPGYVGVIDTSTFKVTGEIGFPAGMGAIGITPDGSTLVTTANYGLVHLVSTTTNKITATIHVAPANGDLGDLTIAADGSQALITDSQNAVGDVVDLTTQQQTRTFPTAPDPTMIAITPDGSEAWIITQQGLQVENLSTYQIAGFVPLPAAVSDFIFVP